MGFACRTESREVVLGNRGSLGWGTRPGKGESKLEELLLLRGQLYGPRGGQLRNLEGCAEDRPPRDERGVGAALPPPGKACPSASKAHAHRCPVGPAGVLTLGQSSSWARASWAIRRVRRTVSTARQLVGAWHTRARCPHPRLPWGSLFSLSGPGQMTQVSPRPVCPLCPPPGQSLAPSRLQSTHRWE